MSDDKKFTDEEFKEGFRQLHLRQYGTLEETDEAFGFEQGWERFNNALKRVCEGKGVVPNNKGKKRR